jgi:hypothetical protein
MGQLTEMKSKTHWIAIVSLVIAILSLTGGFAATYVGSLFFAKSAGSILETKVTNIERHQDHQDNIYQERIYKLEQEMQRLNVNIVLIGERLRVKNLKRGDDNEGIPR